MTSNRKNPLADVLVALAVTAVLVFLVPVTSCCAVDGVKPEDILDRRALAPSVEAACDEIERLHAQELEAGRMLSVEVDGWALEITLLRALVDDDPSGAIDLPPLSRPDESR